MLQALDWLLSNGSAPSPSCWQGIGSSIHLPLQLPTPVTLVYTPTAVDRSHLNCFHRNIFDDLKIKSLSRQRVRTSLTVGIYFSGMEEHIVQGNAILTGKDNNTDIGKYQ